MVTGSRILEVYRMCWAACLAEFQHNFITLFYMTSTKHVISHRRTCRRTVSGDTLARRPTAAWRRNTLPGRWGRRKSLCRRSATTPRALLSHIFLTPYCGWTKSISDHLETMGNRCLLVFTKGSSCQGSTSSMNQPQSINRGGPWV